MNIFLVDKDPSICARALCDLRLNKMILETAQMLCVGYNHFYPDLASQYINILYRETHINHPCNVWQRKHLDNYVWLVRLFSELAKEKLYRSGVQHLSYTKLYKILHEPIKHNYLYTDYIDFSFNCSNVMPSSGNVFEDYKQCLKLKWTHDKREPKWTKRGPPIWQNWNINILRKAHG